MYIYIYIGLREEDLVGGAPGTRLARRYSARRRGSERTDRHTDIQTPSYLLRVSQSLKIISHPARAVERAPLSGSLLHDSIVYDSLNSVVYIIYTKLWHYMNYDIISGGPRYLVGRRGDGSGPVVSRDEANTM